jgi:hypothetical protein
MDQESALLLLDALDNNGNVDGNAVTVEHVINAPWNEISEQIDENQNTEKSCDDFQEGLLEKSSPESDNIIPGHKEIFADILAKISNAPANILHCTAFLFDYFDSNILSVEKMKINKTKCFYLIHFYSDALSQTAST